MDTQERKDVLAKARDLLPKYGGVGNGGELMALNQACLVYGYTFDPTGEEAKALIAVLALLEEPFSWVSLLSPDELDALIQGFDRVSGQRSRAGERIRDALSEEERRRIVNEDEVVYRREESVCKGDPYCNDPGGPACVCPPEQQPSGRVH